MTFAPRGGHHEHHPAVVDRGDEVDLGPHATRTYLQKQYAGACAPRFEAVIPAIVFRYACGQD